MDIISYCGLGSVRFGDQKSAVRDRLGVSFQPFEKALGRDETDAFDDIGLHVYYDGDDRVVYFEAFKPADVRFHGLAFLGRGLLEVEEEMGKLGYVPSRTDVGVQYDDVGIAITAPRGIVEGIGIFCRGYYSEQV